MGPSEWFMRVDNSQLSQVTLLLPHDQLSLSDQESSAGFSPVPHSSVQSVSPHLNVVQFRRVNIYSLWLWVKQSFDYRSFFCLQECLAAWHPAFSHILLSSNPGVLFPPPIGSI